MKISLGCDHGGYELKELVKKHLESKNIEVVDIGTFSVASVDYPDFAYKAAKLVALGEVDRGIVICTTGVGVSIAANKVKGVRCALCTNVLMAKMCRLHNDANMLAMGAGIVGNNLALEMVDAWLSNEFEGGRHERRVGKVMEIEEK